MDSRQRQLDEDALFPEETERLSRAPKGSRGLQREPSQKPSTAQPERRAILAVAALASVGAVFGTATPTGYRASDIIVNALFAAAVTLGASRSRRWAWLWIGGVAALSASSGWAMAPAAAAVVVAFTASALDARQRIWGAAVGALAVQTLVRLPEYEPYGLSTLLVALAVVPVLVSAFRITPRRVRRTIYLATAAVAGVAVVGAVTLGVVVGLTSSDLNRAVSSARSGLEAARDGDDDRAAAQLHDAEREFERADALTSAWWTFPAKLVPVLSQHTLAYESAAHHGFAVTQAGAEVADVVDVDELRFESGRLNVGLVRSAQEPLARNAAALEAASASLHEVSFPWLASPLGDRIDSFSDEVDSTLASASLASDVAEVAPSLLGGDGTRRYFVIFTQPAEARGLGGFMGSWAEITAVDGDLEMTRSGRTEEIRDTPGIEDRTIDGPPDYYTRYRRFEPWKVLQDVTLSPDFPSVAEVMGQVYPQTGGAEVDGVLAVDPYALAALMEFTGPIQIEGLDEPLDSRNAAPFLLRDQYLEYQDDETQRRDFLEEAGSETFEELTQGQIPGPREASRTLDPVVDEDRLVAWSAHPDEQALFEEIGVDGAMPTGEGDFLSLVTQNSGNNKIDVFLERRIRYEAEIDPGSGDVTATATIELTNAIPHLDFPEAVIGNNDQGFPPGTNEVWLNLYTPLRYVSAKVNGETTPLGTEREFDLWVYNQFFRIAPGETLTLELELAGNLGPMDDYRLNFAHQPLVNADEVEVVVSVEPGWRIGSGDGIAADSTGDVAEATWKPERDRTLVAELDRL